MMDEEWEKARRDFSLGASFILAAMTAVTWAQIKDMPTPEVRDAQRMIVTDPQTQDKINCGNGAILLHRNGKAVLPHHQSLAAKRAREQCQKKNVEPQF